MSRVVTFDRKAGNYHYLFVQVRPTDSYLEYWAKCTTEAFTPFSGRVRPDRLSLPSLQGGKGAEAIQAANGLLRFARNDDMP